MNLVRKELKVIKNLIFTLFWINYIRIRKFGKRPIFNFPRNYNPLLGSRSETCPIASGIGSGAKVTTQGVCFPEGEEILRGELIRLPLPVLRTLQYLDRTSDDTAS